MNTPLRRLSWIVIFLFAGIFISSTMVQYVTASSLEKHPDNKRAHIQELSRERQPILAANNGVLAESRPVDDDLKYQREYPSKTLFAHVTGYYSINFGATGIEATENKMLTGMADRLFYRRIQDLLTGKPPQGAAVKLTIDPKAQLAASKALGNQRGAIVAIEPTTGKIKVMVSKPSFDPTPLASHKLDEAATAFRNLDTNKNKPLLNRAIRETYPPGSTFKIITAAAAVEDGLDINQPSLPGPETLKLPQTSSVLRNDWNGPCTGGDGTNITLKDALRQSCNTAFGQLGMNLGPQKLYDQAQKFGFGEDLRIPIPVQQSTMPANLNQPQLAQSAIGQFNDLTTPLQVALTTATIANHGERMKPTLIEEYQAPNKSVVERPGPEKLNEPISSDTADKLTEMMVTVVNEGTGKRAASDNFQVAGKTGTAERGKGLKPHVWFTGFAPADDPKIAVAVVVEEGGRLGDEASGGVVAAPIARKVMEAVVKQ